MVLPVWIRFTDSIGGTARARITELLAACGVVLCAEAVSVGFGIVVFDAIDDALLDLLQRTSRSGLVLGIALAQPALDGRQLWSLIHAGALDVLLWPTLPPTAEDVACRLQRWNAVQRLLESPAVCSALVGSSPPWRSLLRDIVEVAAFSGASVLITGESGTGKELIARLIHQLDQRPDKGEFVVVDCTTISPELSGSEFFGHERGAFTGAQNARDGAFALANRGTLFLDEVGELSGPLQAQLLRVVQEHKFKRVGSNLWQSTEFRLICATNRDLEQGVAGGGFRADFFYRIAGWRCRTVPLRGRPDDILPLAHHFIAQLRPELASAELDAVVREFLLTRAYPGNVRELRQLVARIVQRHTGLGPITIGDIAPEDRPCGPLPGAAWPEHSLRSAVAVAVELGIGMKEISQAASELAVELALQLEGGNLQRAAARLGVTDRALQLRRANQRSTH